MALNSSGAISLGGSTTGQSVALELGQSATAAISLNDTAVRTLAGVSSGAISLYNFYSKSNIATGSQIYTTPGTYSWVVPAGVTSVSVLIVGAGGNGGSGGQYECFCCCTGRVYVTKFGGGGGGSGGSLRANNISVTPGTTKTVVVAAPTSNCVPSTNTYFCACNYLSVRGGGGGNGRGAPGYRYNTCGPASAGYSGAYGGYGGSTGNKNSSYQAGGGGGAGAPGYNYPTGTLSCASQGGNGSAYTSQQGAGISGRPGQGSGGGGSGGRGYCGGRGGGGGGGVGLTGGGADGVGGCNNTGTGWPGTGGSCGSGGGFPSNQTGGCGADFGSGGGGGASNGSLGGTGGSAAVRIVWPGNTRQFPTTNVGGEWVPTNIIATATSPTSATVAFTAPTSNGGSTIYKYIATSSPGGITGILNQAVSGTITMTGLSASTAYTFTVKATNRFGTSMDSAVSNSITTYAAGAPGAPTIGTVIAGSTTVAVPFTAPTSNGGYTITSYTATSSPDGITGTLNQSGSGTITVSGLTAGRTYTFTVKATNSSGSGPDSAPSNSVTTVVANSQSYTTPGTYTWIAPANVTSVSIVAVGGGGGGSSARLAIGNYSLAGGGGGLAYRNNFTVTPGSSYSVVVGAGGVGSATCSICSNGGTSRFNCTTVYATGGGGYNGNNVGGSGFAACGVGRTGGTGGSAPLTKGAGGGGAAGYSGNGGNGGIPPTCCNPSNYGSGYSGSGGGGAGGNAANCSPNYTTGGGGGGVGIFGEGASGLPGALNTLQGGYGGSGGGYGGTGGRTSCPPYPTGGAGGNYGGGGGSGYTRSQAGGAGGSGAVRIVWPGTTRQFGVGGVGSP